MWTVSREASTLSEDTHISVDNPDLDIIPQDSGVVLHCSTATGVTFMEESEEPLLLPHVDIQEQKIQTSPWVREVLIELFGYSEQRSVWSTLGRRSGEKNICPAVNGGGFTGLCGS